MTDEICGSLSERIKAKKSRGLVDIKLYLSKNDDTGAAEVRTDLQKFFDAIDDGRFEDLDFGDLCLRRPTGQR